MTAIELFLVTTTAIAILFVLVIKFKIHAFISLMLTSVFVGILTGMPFMDVIESVQEGMGDILGFIAIVVGIGSIFGEILQVSGGAESLSRSMLKKFGEERSSWAMMTTGFIIAIPVFLDVGFIILVPMAYALARKTGRSVLYYAIPLLAGLAVTHAFIPPTPGPIAVAEIIDVQLGWVILFGFIVGFPTAVIAGPYFAKYIAKKIHVDPPDLNEERTLINADKHKSLPSFGWVVFLIALPLALILASTFIDLALKNEWVPKSGGTELIRFLGHPFIALLIATLAAMYFLGFRRKYTGKQLMQVANRALGPAGLIILVTGAGGVFKQILVDSGVGAALAETVSNKNIPPVVLAYILAVIIRLTQGSATVAMITAAGMVAPVIQILGTGDIGKSLVVLVIAAGATIFSHVNDSGFWLVGRYLNMNEKQTLQSWSVMETIISVVGFIFILIISFLVPE
ncbi:MAG: GntP family permease [Cytophagales bacterium]|nr:GntP family permease [Cytophagales bacterium]